MVLECELSRKPREAVKWLHNGKPFSVKPRQPGVTVEEDKQSTIHRITFTQLPEEELLGEYTVEVENIASTGGLEMKGTCAPINELLASYSQPNSCWLMLAQFL